MRPQPRPTLIPEDRESLEVEAMKERFRRVHLRKRTSPWPYHALEIELQPFMPGCDPGLIAANLMAGDEILIHKGGGIEPGNLTRKPIPVNRTPSLHRKYVCELLAREAPGYPLAFGTSPVIDRSRIQLEHLLPFEHPERHRYPAWPKHALCFVTPQLVNWRWGVNTIADITPDLVTYFACVALVMEAGMKDWMVAGAPHDLQVLKRVVPHDADCPCYSGYRFKECHLLAA